MFSPHPFVCMYLQALTATPCLPWLNIKSGSVCCVWCCLLMVLLQVSVSHKMKHFTEGGAARLLDGGRHSISPGAEICESSVSAPTPSVLLLQPLFFRRFTATWRHHREGWLCEFPEGLGVYDWIWISIWPRLSVCPAVCIYKPHFVLYRTKQTKVGFFFWYEVAKMSYFLKCT